MRPPSANKKISGSEIFRPGRSRRFSREPSRRNHHRGGFTLIEVLIALGICVSVLVVLLGILPGALNQMNKAADLVNHQRITDLITGEAQLTQWEDFLNMDGKIRYFDNQGAYIPDELLSQKQNSITYAAKIVLPQKNEGLYYPGITEPNDYTRRIVIHVANTTKAPFDFANIEFNPKVETYSSVLARMSSQEQL